MEIDRKRFTEDPMFVVASFLEELPDMPDDNSVRRAALMITTSKLKGESFRICTDLAMEHEFVTKSTCILALLFFRHDKALPKCWETNRENMRKALGITISSDLRYLEAASQQSDAEINSSMRKENVKILKQFQSALMPQGQIVDDLPL